MEALDITEGKRRFRERNVQGGTTSSSSPEREGFFAFDDFDFKVPAASNRLALGFELSAFDAAGDTATERFVEITLGAAKDVRKDELAWLVAVAAEPYRIVSVEKALASAMSVLAFKRSDLLPTIEKSLLSLITRHPSSEARRGVFVATLDANIGLARRLKRALAPAPPQAVVDLLPTVTPAPQAPLPGAAQLRELLSRGASSRAAPDAPRGSVDTAATVRSADLSLPEETLRSVDNEERAGLAAEVLGEWGGEPQVESLSHAMQFRDSLRVRQAAAAALGNIGGQRAVERLRRMVASSAAPASLRAASLSALLDLLTGGWQTYVMSPARMPLPQWLNQDLKLLRDDVAMQALVESIDPMFA